MKAQRFFRAVYHDNGIRRELRRSFKNDAILYTRNRALQPFEHVLSRYYRDDRLPVALIVGTPRSGTTLLFQLIARFLEVGYPSNFVARYWMAPVIGTAIFERRARTSRRAEEIALRSTFGGTEGVASPHEFFWFWAFFAEPQATDDLGEGELDRFDWAAIRRELGALAGFTSRPYVLKSLNHVVYNIPRFARELPQSVFIDIERDPRFVVQSILECRVRRYGDAKLWWSIRPRDIDHWRDRDPVDQVCHQVLDIRRGIEAGLRELHPSRRLSLTYEELIASPNAVLERVSRFLGARVRGGDIEPLELESANTMRIDAARLAAVEEGLKRCG